MASSISPYIDWDILTWLQKLTSLPVVIKGIQCVEDAVLAYDYGVQGIVLSNHGGRSQDTYVVQPKSSMCSELTAIVLNRHFLLCSRYGNSHLI